MNSEEVQQAMTYLKDLWPRWEPTPSQMSAWQTFLTTIPDTRSARAAISRSYALKSRFREPQISDIADALAGQPHEEGREGGVGSVATGMWLVDRANPVMPIPMCYPEGRAPEENAIRAWAENRRKARQEIYGGDWVIVVGCKSWMHARVAVDADFLEHWRDVYDARKRSKGPVAGPILNLKGRTHYNSGVTPQRETT